MIDTLQTKNDITQVMKFHDWDSARKHHVDVLEKILNPYLKKRSEQKKDPVLDFLFEYYKFRPSHLLRWSPGAGIVLEYDGNPDSLPAISELTTSDHKRAFLDLNFFPEKRLRAVRWILDLLIKTDQSKPFFGCFGMHEWAMVYKSENIRHNQLPLRFSDERVAEIVESQPVLCTHFDAFRFFTDAAKPLNKQQLSRETFQDSEQPGCIHSNMDIYKWAYKLYPWISSDLIREAFLVAVHARTIDMKASPYDLRDQGLEPIKIETESGRKLYQKHQTEIMDRAKPVRRRLIVELEQLLRVVE